MGTIEYTDNNIIKKLALVDNIIKIIIVNNPESAKKMKNIYISIRDDYNMVSLRILHKYFTSDMTESEKDAIIFDYHQELSKKSIPDRLDNIIADIKFKNYESFSIKKMVGSFHNIPSYNSPCSITRLSSKRDIFCYSCDSSMIVNNENSEMICPNCGEIQPIIGTVFDDIQIYYQEGPFTKLASYERIKHGEKWLNRIQAREHIEIKREVISAIKRQIKNEQITDIRKVTYELIRKCLRKVGFTKYNEHIPLIRKIITGISPIQLTEEEYSVTINYFDKVVDIFEQKKPTDKHNCPYHPYFLRKILEQNFILPENTFKKLDRKRKILSNIHTQSITTLKKRDKIWRDICGEITEFVYTPTDKNKYRVPI